MRDDLLGLLEKADLALASSAGVVPEDTLAPLVAAVRSVRTRMAYPDDVLVVALAGGTGSGKSSLFNVLAGEELVDVGGVRPTTSLPAAAVPRPAGSSLDGYLDHLGIVERHVYEGGAACLLDLPDTDSVEVDHRHRVDALLPLVDVVVWVTDPEKYRDARLHHSYLAPLAAYGEQQVFVLNQIDRLAAGQAGQVLDDLVQALETDGFENPMVLPMSAAPPSGPPIGVERLRAALETRLGHTGVLYEKLLTDLAAAAARLEAEAGAGLDFDTRAVEVVANAADLLATGEASRAGEVLTDFLDRLASESGGLSAGRIEAVAATVPAHVRRISAELGEIEPVAEKRWFRRRRELADPMPRVERARDLLSEAIVRPTRAILAGRAVAVASVAELGVDVESLRSQARR